MARPISFQRVYSLCGAMSIAVVCVAVSLAILCVNGSAAHAASPDKRTKPQVVKASAATTAVRNYAEAVALGNHVAAGRLDFACQYRMATGTSTRMPTFPAEADPIYNTCWQSLEAVHQTVVEQHDQGMNTVWPGKDTLVFFAEDLTRYAPSIFVMDRVGTSPPGSGLILEVAAAKPLPAVSFRLKENGPLVAAPATLVTMRVTYKDALSSPITYAPGAYRWTNTVKRPQKALRTVMVSWVAITGVKKLGLPGDVAVVNMPVSRVNDPGGAIPFLTEPGGYVPKSAIWWEPADAPGLLVASVGRASLLPDLRNRVALLNRVLLIDPAQPDALALLTRDLYDNLLALAPGLHQIQISDQGLAMRFNQLYWDTYAQTTRTEISLGMEMGGFSQPTPADYLYRLVPAMEMLAKVRPDDLENRIRLGIIYRWNNDQMAAINTHAAVVKDLPPSRTNQLARAMIELAWSRIARIAWNRSFDDPSIVQAYQEAEVAYALTDRPIEKFTAAYTMAYSLLFTPNRDNHAILDRLTDAHEWYLKLPGSSPDSWAFLLSNDNMKGVVEADPAFQPLIARDHPDTHNARPSESSAVPSPTPAQ